MSSHQRWLDHHTSRKHTAHGGSSRFVSRMSPSPAPGNCGRLTRRRRHKRVVPLLLWKYLMSLISETQQTDGWAGIVSATVRVSLSPAVAAGFQDSSSGRAFDWLHACGVFLSLDERWNAGRQIRYYNEILFKGEHEKPALCFCCVHISSLGELPFSVSHPWITFLKVFSHLLLWLHLPFFFFFLFKSAQR